MTFGKAKDGLLDTHPNPPKGRELECHAQFCLSMYNNLP